MHERPDGPGEWVYGRATTVSNIPFNTIASILTTGSVQRQTAATAAKRTQDDKQVQQVFKVQTDRRAEEVEDPGNNEVDALHDEPDKHNQQQKRKQQQHEDAAPQREVVDIAQLSAEAAKAPGTPRPKVPPVVRSTLDLSA